MKGKNMSAYKVMTHLLAIVTIFNWQRASAESNHTSANNTTAVRIQPLQDSTLYQTQQLTIRRLSAHVYQHISWLTTNSFGKVDCNGMVIVSQHEAVIFDTPTNDTSAAELIKYLQDQGYRIKAIVATHFHEDCVGGLQAFGKNKIPAYASFKTIELLKSKSNNVYQLLKGFTDSLTLEAGGQKVHALYCGEGHTKDNIVGYYPQEHVLFGGCLIKADGAGKGFLDDANTTAWPVTVARVKQRYPGLAIVIPGHGKPGGPNLLDYTIQLFDK